MLSNKFIDLLEAENLLDPEMIEELRRQVAQSGNRLPVETLAKLLVDNEQLTKFQATRLVSQLKSGRTAPAPVVTAASLDEDLTIAEPEEAQEDEDKSSQSKGKRPVFSDDPGEAELDVGKYNRSSTDAGNQAESIAEFRRPARIATKTVIEKPSKWETFRTVGAVGILIAVITAFVFLFIWFSRGNAADQLEAAKAAYEHREFGKAMARYQEFASNNPTHEEVSFARARMGIAKIRDVTENSGDTFEAMEIAKKTMPEFIDEPGFNGIRGELATALVSLGERMVNKAESAKTTEERKKYVEGIKQELELINNPLYIAGTERRQNEPGINALEESRQRLLRDIQLSEDRVKAVAEMKAALEKSDVVAAYAIRQTVVRRYPQLQSDTELSELLVSATSLIQKSVKSAAEKPQAVTEEEHASIGKRIFLSSNTGSPVQLSQNRTLFFRAKSGIYGIDAASGKVKWRRYAEGLEQSDILNVTDGAVSGDAGADGIATESALGKITRLSGDKGTTVWSLNFGGPVFEPQLDGNVLYVTERQGRISCIDAETGAVRWSTQLPQPITCGPNAGKVRQTLFVVGENANLYSISKRDGNCSAVFYLGHEANTIHVPPVAILGRLLVFENYGPGYSQIRTLAIGEDESVLKESQDAVRLQGHVVVSPQVDGRRSVVVTNLGETSVFEVESVNGNAVLTKMASLVASEKTPRTSWPLFVNNDIWIASTQLTKLQVQASKQQIIREWVRDDGDRFLGRPVALEDAVVHVRNVRGTEGVRIAAMNKSTGEPIWETNVGVPVVGLVMQGSSLGVVTSQASLYTIGSENMASGRVDGPSANPGRNQRQLMFNRVAVNNKGYLIAINSERGSQLAYYDPTAQVDRRLIVIASAGGEAKPTGDPVWLVDGVVIPLGSGQLVAVDPATGSTIGTPIQPPLEPGHTVQWTTPALLSDGTTLMAANSDNILVKIATGKQFNKLQETTTANKLGGSLASLNDTVFVPTFGEQASYVEVYNGADLVRQNAVAIEGKIPWGLYSVGEVALAYSNLEGIVAIGPDGQKRWTTPLKNVAPVGKPQLIDNHIVIATVTGEIYQIDPQDGKITGVIKTGESISSQPLFVKTAMFVPGDDGNVLAITPVKFEAYEGSGSN